MSKFNDFFICFIYDFTRVSEQILEVFFPFLTIIIDWQLLVLISRCFSFIYLHWQFIMLARIVCRRQKFSFYWFDLECFLVFLFGMVFFLSFLIFLFTGVCSIILLSNDALFNISCFFKTLLIRHLDYNLVGMLSTAASVWAVSELSYSIWILDSSRKVWHPFLFCFLQLPYSDCIYLLAKREPVIS